MDEWTSGQVDEGRVDEGRVDEGRGTRDELTSGQVDKGQVDKGRIDEGQGMRGCGGCGGIQTMGENEVLKNERKILCSLFFFVFLRNDI